ncbi:E3 ubiquitin-protein ligase XIAP-like [Ornithodoros turicata]|uniref:E3 ubiquitin-protein ligase XIAP-like n=1 Tax=Ornithodoros turicata TaxID=34597 RepID=UPI003139CF86
MLNLLRHTHASTSQAPVVPFHKGHESSQSIRKDDIFDEKPCSLQGTVCKRNGIFPHHYEYSSVYEEDGQRQPDATDKKLEEARRFKLRGVTPSTVPDDFRFLPNELDLFLKCYPPKNGEWKDTTRRLKSYGNASGICRSIRGGLCYAGLYATDNITTCFHCGGCHADWTDADDPFVEHSRWYPECQFVRFIGGDYAVNYIRRQHEEYLRTLAERGQQEAKESHKALVEELFDGEDIQFYEASDIRVEVLHLAASLLAQRTQRSRVTRDDIVQELSKLCQLKLDKDWRSIPRNKKASSPTLIDLRKEHVHECNAPEHRPSPGPSFGSIGVLRGIPKYPRFESIDARYATFSGFPHSATMFLDAHTLADAGLFYTGESDTTLCFYCGLRLIHWEPFGDPYTEHHRWSPRCDYIRSVVDHERTPDIVGLSSSSLVQQEQYAASRNAYTVPHSRPVHPRYATLASRESSFESYPRNAKGNKEKMAKAGFFFTGTGDQTTCFQCGNSLCSWDEDDDPLLEHDRWYPNCPYVVLIRGVETIKDVREAHRNTFVQRQTAEISRSDDLSNVLLRHLMSSPLVHRLTAQGIDPLIVELAIRKRLNGEGLIDVLDEQDLRRALTDVVSLPENVRTKEVPKADTGDLSKCVICKTGDRRIIFLPCNHLIACIGCAASHSVCPSCNRPIATRRQAFLA